MSTNFDPVRATALGVRSDRTHDLPMGMFDATILQHLTCHLAGEAEILVHRTRPHHLNRNRHGLGPARPSPTQRNRAAAMTV
jgi:hypothetical protein